MSSSSMIRNRVHSDIMKLMKLKNEVIAVNGINEFLVKFKGPIDTPYEGGTWFVRVNIPDRYPFKSPSIGFTNRIYHPNIDEASGTVCLDVINQTWSPVYDLCNIFDLFLPHLLAYPNPVDSLNADAAALYMRNPQEFKRKVKEYVQKFAIKEKPNIGISGDNRRFGHSRSPNNTAMQHSYNRDDESKSEESEMSDFSENGDNDCNMEN